MIKVPENILDLYTTKSGDYYVYCAYQGSELLYIGFGKGDRIKHVNSGKSHNPYLNKRYFMEELLDYPKVTSSKIVTELTKNDALDLEKYLIYRHKPLCNVRGVNNYTNTLESNKLKKVKNTPTKSINIYAYLKSLIMEDINSPDVLDYLYEIAKDWDSVFKDNVINTALYTYMAYSKSRGDTGFYDKLVNMKALLVEGVLRHDGYRTEDLRTHNTGRPNGFVKMFNMTAAEKAAYYRWVNKENLVFNIEDSSDVKTVSVWLDKRRKR